MDKGYDSDDIRQQLTDLEIQLSRLRKIGLFRFHMTQSFIKSVIGSNGLPREIEERLISRGE